MNTIGRYQLVEKLGQGGMGVVYRGYDPLLERVVAVKLIGSIDADSEVRQRFLREARAAGQLSHKNIVTIYDLGEHEGQPYLAMELLEGQDLQQRMAAVPSLTLPQKVELAIELCEAIEYAHQHGIVHRDIKPANIFITTGGRLKMLDFGLARIITSELTNSNMMMGTLNYMAPEQVRGERADNRSDIFSTGVVLYELLGGRRAFSGDSFGATLYKILQEIPEPLPNLDATLPPDLVAIVERALQKDPNLRYQQMGEMADDLSAFRQQVLLMHSPPGGRTPAAWTALDPDALTVAAPTPVPRPKSDYNRTQAVRPASAPPSSPTVAVPLPAAPPARNLGPLLAAAGVGALLLAIVLVWSLKRDGEPPVSPTQTATAPTRAETPPPAAPATAPAAKPEAAAPSPLPPPVSVDQDPAKSVGAFRARTDQARNAALAAGAPTLAARAFQLAVSVQQRAVAAERGGRHNEASARYSEASGLFRGAELAAVAEASARSERAQQAQPERKPQQSAPPAPPPPSPPPPPVTSGGLPLPTPSQPVVTPPPAPAADKPAEVKPPAVSPTAGINELLERYESALESRSLDALKRLWPSLGGAQQTAIRDEFQNTSRINVEIINPQISVQGTTATVTFLRRYELETTDRQRLRRESRTTMQLQRTGSAWVIERMRFEPVR